MALNPQLSFARRISGYLLWLLCAFAFPVNAQQPPDVIQQTITALTPVAGQRMPAMPFSRLVDVAAALEKTRAWKSPEAERIRVLLPDPGKQCLGALQQLLADGDTRAAVALRETRAWNVSWKELAEGATVLRQAGCATAADALTVVSSDVPATIFTALLHLPADKRSPLEEFLYERYHSSNNPMNYTMMTSAAMRIYGETPPEDQAIRDGMLHLIALFGYGGHEKLLMNTSRLYAGGKTANALYLLQWALTRTPDDTTLQRDVAKILLQNDMRCSLPDQFAFLGWMNQALKPHYVRRLRREIMAWHVNNRNVPEANKAENLVHDPDPLVAAESHLALQHYTEAAALYTSVLQNPREPLYRRLAAWSGCWDTTPDTAVAAIPALTDAVITLPAGSQRTAAMRWFGGEMGRVVPSITNGLAVKWPKATMPACYTVMAASMSRLLATDPVACLRAEEMNGPSLRYAATLVYLMANMGKEANQVLAQRVDYQEFLRPGTRFAPTMAKLREPVAVSSPRLSETEDIAGIVAQQITDYHLTFGTAHATMMVTPEPPNTMLITDICAQLATRKDEKDLDNAMRRLGKQLASSMLYLDPKPYGLLLNAPPPPPRAVNIAYLTPIATAITNAFDNPLVGKHAGPFITEGLQPSWLTASNPELVEGLFTLTTGILDRCMPVAGNDESVKASLINLTGYIASRQVWDFKPYAEKLKNRYVGEGRK